MKVVLYVSICLLSCFVVCEEALIDTQVDAYLWHCCEVLYNHVGSYCVFFFIIVLERCKFYCASR